MAGKWALRNSKDADYAFEVVEEVVNVIVGVEADEYDRFAKLVKRHNRDNPAWDNSKSG